VVGGVVPPRNAADPPDVRTFLVPRRDYTIEDNWHVMGLCGTGSKDLVVAEAFVPEYRTHSYRDAFQLTNPGTVVNDGPLYRLPLGVVFPNALASPAVGVALGALTTFREQSKTRVNVRDQTRVAEDPFIHLRLAESAAEVDAARDRMLANFAGMMRLVSAGSEIPLTQRARYRWDAAKAIDWSVRAVDRLFEATGGRGIFLDNPVQRAWRDVHAMRAHVANNPEKVSTVFGRSEFDLPPLDIRF
jgi:3-hydroxy-9,10-secoandrosta-1,3,5(10)-triene-9,17-dione monooxygenase